MTKYLYMDNESLKLFVDGEWCKKHMRQQVMKKETCVDLGIVLSPQASVNKYYLQGVIRQLPEYKLYNAEVGVLNSNREYLPGTGMAEMRFVDLKLPDEIPFVNKTVIWGGLLIPHYGHFLLQSTTRLYYYLKNCDKSTPIVFAVFNQELPKYMRDFFDLLNIPPEHLILVDKPTQFKKVICPALSSVYYKDWTEDFILPFSEAAKDIKPAPYEKVFFSRKHWSGLAKCFGEENLEKVFNKNGFHSVEMQNLSLKEQISIIKGAKVLAGINGTAFHNILFGQKGKQLILLNRNEEYDSQYIVNEAAEAECFVVQAYENPLPVNHPHGPFIVGLTKYVKSFLKDFGLDDFNVSFDPLKYVNRFYKLYFQTYCQNNFYIELCVRDKNKIEVGDLFKLKELCAYSRFKELLFRILSKVTLGNAKLKFKQEYKRLKKLKSTPTEFKY